MKWTSERWAAIFYVLAALAVGGVWFIILAPGTSRSASPAEMLRAFLFEGSYRAFAWTLAALPVLFLLLAAAYLTPLAKDRRGSVGLWLFGIALAAAAWATMMVPVAILATVPPLLVITLGSSAAAAGANNPKCPRCSADITRPHIAIATFPYWLSCRSCKAPLIGDKVVRRVTAVFAAVAVLWLVGPVIVTYLLDADTGMALSMLTSIVLVAAWAATVIVAWRYGTYVERQPATPAGWWSFDIWQWLRRHRHNASVLAGCTLLFLAFFVGSLWLVESYGDLEWVSTAHSPYVYAAFGFGIYFLLAGHPWTRVVLSAAVPLAVRAIVTLLGHVPAGDLDTALVFGAYDGVVFAMGATIASVFAWLAARKQTSPVA